MNQFKNHFIRLLVVMSLVLVSITAQAQETFEQAGVITALGYDSFTLAGRKHVSAVDMRLKSNNASRVKLSDLKAGDIIWCKGIVLNGVRYVKLISYKTPGPPS